ncbi:MAG: carbohydrate kinase family protein [Candidatus Methanomethylophilaceae archaeon]
MFDVCVVGGCGMDRIFVTGKDGTVSDVPDSVVPAGKGANQAVAAARAGGSVCVISCVGDDDNGVKVISNLEREGIDVSNIRISAGHRTDVNDVIIGTDGDNTIVRGTDATDTLSPEIIDSCTDTILDSRIVMTHTKIPAPALDRLLEICSENGIPVSLTPCHPDKLDLSTEEGMRRFGSVRYVTANRSESLAVTGCATPEDAVLRCGGKLISTLGGDGVMFMDGGLVRIPAPKIERVKDTTGAGDTFAGNLAYRLSGGMPLGEAVRISQYAASYKVMYGSAQAGMPYPDQLERFMEGSAEDLRWRSRT